MNKREIYQLVLMVFGLIFIASGLTHAFDLEALRNSDLKTLKYVPDQILVTFKEGVADSIKAEIHKNLGALKVRESYGKFYHVVTVREGGVEEMVKAYSQNPWVEIAEPDYLRIAYFTPNDEYYTYQWNFVQINLPLAWNKSTGSGVTVAVIDTGVNPNGEDGFGSRLLPGYDFIWRNNNSVDDNGHGTHVAGTIGEETNNLIGCAGVAFNADILPVKVLNSWGLGFSSAIIDGIRWATDNGADVINLSLGAPTSVVSQ